MPPELAAKLHESLVAIVASTASTDPYRPPLTGGAHFVYRLDTNDYWFGATGYRDGQLTDPLLPLDHAWFGSATKTLTAALILRLRDQGRLELDRRLADYAGLLPTPIPAERSGEPITIRDLLSMTSGLHGAMNSGPAPGDADVWFGAFHALCTKQTAWFWMAGWTAQYWRERYAPIPPVFSPGEFFEYNNTNYILLAEIAEYHTGKSFKQAIADEILTPIGLTPARATIRNDTEPFTSSGNGAHVEGNQWNGSRWVDRRGCLGPGTARGASGLITDNLDYAVFLVNLFAGNLFPGGADTVAEMQATVERTPVVGGLTGYKTLPGTASYGMGMFYFTTALGMHDDIYGHGGEEPGFAALWLYNATRHELSVSFMNAGGAGFPSEVEYVMVDWGKMIARDLGWE